MTTTSSDANCLMRVGRPVFATVSSTLSTLDPIWAKSIDLMKLLRLGGLGNPSLAHRAGGPLPPGLRPGRWHRVQGRAIVGHSGAFAGTNGDTGSLAGKVSSRA